MPGRAIYYSNCYFIEETFYSYRCGLNSCVCIWWLFVVYDRILEKYRSVPVSSPIWVICVVENISRKSEVVFGCEVRFANK